MKKRVYIETTIPSYLTAVPSRDVLRSAHQKITRQWWSKDRLAFDLYASQLVLDEAAKGDPTAAADRLSALRDVTLLPVTEAALAFANELIANSLLPEKAKLDALHIGVATVHRLDFLLTWNCRHLANATIEADLRRFAYTMGYEIPVICTPEVLSGDTGESYDR